MPRPALPLVCAVALCVVALRAAAETDDMMRWKPAICGTRASCEIVDITAAGRGAGGELPDLSARPSGHPARLRRRRLLGGHSHVRPPGGIELRPAKTLCSLRASPYIALIPGHPPPACRAASRSATETD
jgi:hypothetical protein